jgi:hypothetical protein
MIALKPLSRRNAASRGVYVPAPGSGGVDGVLTATGSGALGSQGPRSSYRYWGGVGGFGGFGAGGDGGGGSLLLKMS